MLPFANLNSFLAEISYPGNCFCKTYKQNLIINNLRPFLDEFRITFDAYWLSSNSTYLNVSLQIKCHTKVHGEFWSYNVPRNETEKAVIGLVNHAFGLFVCYTDETALFCCQCTITRLKSTVISTGFLETEGIIRDRVTVSGFQESKLLLVLWSAVHEVWKGDFNTFAELVALISFDA